jgi:acetamidase/formamidase
MTTQHKLLPVPSTLHGFFSRDLHPVLTVDSGDRVTFQTLDSGWGAIEQEPGFVEPQVFFPRDIERDVAHPLCGPVEIRGAKPGMTLEVRVNRIRPGRWGWSAGPKLPSQLDARLGLETTAAGPPSVLTVPRGEAASFWDIDPDAEVAVDRSGNRLRLRPFMGIMGMPLDVPGKQSTFPPTNCGGNLDCRELTEGAVLFLPIAVDGGLYSTGDGHAVQGDGEVAGPALNCPMEVECEFHLHPDMELRLPRARTRDCWITFGFSENLNESAIVATVEMVKLMGELYGFDRKEALSLASLVVDLRVTQIVNGIRGVHAMLRHDAIEKRESTQESTVSLKA